MASIYLRLKKILFISPERSWTKAEGAFCIAITLHLDKCFAKLFQPDHLVVSEVLYSPPHLLSCPVIHGVLSGTASRAPPRQRPGLAELCICQSGPRRIVEGVAAVGEALLVNLNVQRLNYLVIG